MKQQGKYFFVTLIIVGMIVFIYFTTNSDQVQYAISYLTDNPIYRGNSDKNAVSFITRYKYDVDNLAECLADADKNNIKLTIFVDVEWAEKNGDMLISAVEYGHEIGLADDGDSADKLSEARQKLEVVLNRKVSFYMPLTENYTREAIAAARGIGLKTVMWNRDTRKHKEDNVAASLSDCIAQNDIIVIDIATVLKEESVFADLGIILASASLESVNLSDLICD